MERRISRLKLSYTPIVKNLHLFPTFNELEYGLAPNMHEVMGFNDCDIPLNYCIPQYFKQDLKAEDANIKRICDFFDKVVCTQSLQKIEHDYNIEEIKSSYIDFDIFGDYAQQMDDVFKELVIFDEDDDHGSVTESTGKPDISVIENNFQLTNTLLLEIEQGLNLDDTDFLSQPILVPTTVTPVIADESKPTTHSINICTDLLLDLEECLDLREIMSTTNVAECDSTTYLNNAKFTNDNLSYNHNDNDFTKKGVTEKLYKLNGGNLKPGTSSDSSTDFENMPDLNTKIENVDSHTYPVECNSFKNNPFLNGSVGFTEVYKPSNLSNNNVNHTIRDKETKKQKINTNPFLDNLSSSSSNGDDTSEVDYLIESSSSGNDLSNGTFPKYANYRKFENSECDTDSLVLSPTVVKDMSILESEIEMNSVVCNSEPKSELPLEHFDDKIVATTVKTNQYNMPVPQGMVCSMRQMTWMNQYPTPACLPMPPNMVSQRNMMRHPPGFPRPHMMMPPDVPNYYPFGPQYYVRPPVFPPQYGPPPPPQWSNTYESPVLPDTPDFYSHYNQMLLNQNRHNY